MRLPCVLTDGRKFDGAEEFKRLMVEDLDRFAETLWIRTVGQSIYAAQSSDATVVAAYADQHAAMLAAIERGDAELAERLTREHILASPVPEALGTPQT